MRVVPALQPPRGPPRGFLETRRTINPVKNAIGSAAASGMAGQASAAAARQPVSFSSCAHPEIAALIRDKYADLGSWPSPSQLPVLYNPAYNIGFWGLERLHPFDSKKFQRVLAILEEGGVLRSSQLVTAQEATHSVLREVHTEAYLQKLNNNSFFVAQVTELAPLAFLPPALLRRKVLRPMATMAGGSMMAAALALERGWAINLGGGMHHACHDQGGGWCPYADIHLATRRLRAASGGRLRRVMVVDLDVHQGNGVERCKQHFGEQGETYVVDVYNGAAYPWDTHAKQAIDAKREVAPGTADAEYLAAVGSALQQAFAEFRPQLLVYNAGTDILSGDPLGRLAVSAEGVVQRDEMVWRAALEHGVPIVQLLSGGYTRQSTPCIAASIKNLFDTFDLGNAAAVEQHS